VFPLSSVARTEPGRLTEHATQTRLAAHHVEHIEGDGALVEHACKLGLEGIVSKRADAPYRSGKRPEWIKTKCAAWREANRDRFEKMEKSR
jgi:ATP-dependent DNA ligase